MECFVTSRFIGLSIAPSHRVDNFAWSLTSEDRSLTCPRPTRENHTITE